MKHINNYIFEKLKLGKDLKFKSMFVPETYKELKDYITQQKHKAPHIGSVYGTKERPVDLSFIDFSALYQNSSLPFDGIDWLLEGEDEIAYLDASNWIIGTPKDGETNMIFSSMTNLKYINISNWDIRSVDNLCGLFNNCRQLEKIDGIENFDVSNLKVISSLFRKCESLKSLDLSKWNTQNVERMRNIFCECSNLKEIDLTGWNLKNLEKAKGAFSGCISLETIKGIENIEMPKCFIIDDMFKNCKKLKADLENLNPNDKRGVNTFLGANEKIIPSWYIKQ